MKNLLCRHAQLLVIMIISLSLLCLLTAGNHVIRHFEQRLVTDSGEALVHTAQQMAGALDAVVLKGHDDLYRIAQAFDLHGPSATGASLETLRAASPALLWVAVMDESGRIAASTDPAEIGRDRGLTPWFQTTRKHGRAQVREVSRDADDRLKAVLTLPVTNARGEFRGMVASRLRISTADIFEQTRRIVGTSPHPSLPLRYQIIDRKGEVLVDSTHPAGTANLQQFALPSVTLLRTTDRPGHVEEMGLEQAVPVVTGYARTQGRGDFTGPDLAVLVRTDRRDILEQIAGIREQLASLGLLLGFVMLVSLVWMVGHLRREWAHAKEREEWLTMALKHLGEATIVTDAAGAVAYMNPLAESLTGWRHEDAKGKSLSSIFTVIHEGTRQTAENLVAKILKGTGSVRIADPALLIAKDGTEKPLDGIASPVKNPQGDIIGIVLIFHRVASLKRLDEDYLRFAQDQLKLESRQRYRLLLKAPPAV